MCPPSPFKVLRNGVFRHNERTTLRIKGNFGASSGKWIGRGQKKTRFRAWRAHLLNSIENVHTKLIGTQSLSYRSRPHSGIGLRPSTGQKTPRLLSSVLCHLFFVLWLYSAARRPQRMRAACSLRRHLQTAVAGLLSARCTI